MYGGCYLRKASAVCGLELPASALTCCTGGEQAVFLIQEGCDTLWVLWIIINSLLATLAVMNEGEVIVFAFFV